MNEDDVRNRKDAMVYMLLQLNEKNKQIELGEAFFSSGYTHGIESFEGLMDEMDEEGLIKKKVTPNSTVSGIPFLHKNKITYEISFKGVEYLASIGQIQDSTISLNKLNNQKTTISGQNVIYNEGNISGDQTQYYANTAEHESEKIPSNTNNMFSKIIIGILITVLGTIIAWYLTTYIFS